MVQTVCFLTRYPDVKYVRLGYIGTCNMEHIETLALAWVSPIYLMFLLSSVHVWDLREREQYIVNDTVSLSQSKNNDTENLHQSKNDGTKYRKFTQSLYVQLTFSSQTVSTR